MFAAVSISISTLTFSAFAPGTSEWNPPAATAPLERSQHTLSASTSFELDFWGRVRSLKAAALESYLASAAAQRAATLSLIAQTANAYVSLCELNERIDLAARTVAIANSVAFNRSGTPISSASMESSPRPSPNSGSSTLISAGVTPSRRSQCVAARRERRA